MVYIISKKLQCKAENWPKILCEEAIKEKNLSIIPLFKLVFKFDISLTSVINAADYQNEQEMSSMIITILGHLDYLKQDPKFEKAIKAVRGMVAELVKMAMVESRSQLVELFLDKFHFEEVAVNIPLLLEKSCLWYKPNWLRKLFEKGAKLHECDRISVKTVFEKQYEQKSIKLEIIQLLVENGAEVSVCIPNTTVIHSVVRLIQDTNGNVDTLDLVCSKFDFQCHEICDKEGKTPWHLALAGKYKIGIKICKVLRKYPIDPSKKDNNGRRADYGMKEEDERVKILLQKRDEELKGGDKEGARGTVKKVKKKRKKKDSTKVDKAREFERQVEENESMPGVLETSDTLSIQDELEEKQEEGIENKLSAPPQADTLGENEKQQDVRQQKVETLKETEQQKSEEKNFESSDTVYQENTLQGSELKHAVHMPVMPDEGIECESTVKQALEKIDGESHHGTTEDRSSLDSEHDREGDKVSNTDHVDIKTSPEALENEEKRLKFYLNELHSREDEYFYLVPKESKPTEVHHAAASNAALQETREVLVPHKSSIIDSTPKQSADKDSFPVDEQGVNFDKGPWDIECSKKVMKILSGKKNNHIKEIFVEKMNLLSQGNFMDNFKHCKPVSSIKGIELYETRLNKKDRVIWQIVPQLYLPHGGVQYKEIIRVWDIVLDHDDIHHHVQVIQNNIVERARQVPDKLKVTLVSTPLVQSNVHGGKREPRTFKRVQDVAQKEGSDVVMYSPPMNPDNHSFCIAHLYSLSNCVVKLMLEDGDIEKSFPYKEWPAEHDIINLPYTKAVLLLGRSGTGKTTCCLYRMWNEYVTYWKKYACRAEELSKPQIASGREDGANTPQPKVKSDEDSSTVKIDEDITTMKSEEDITTMKSEEDITTMKSEEDITTMKSEEDITTMKSEEDVDSEDCTYPESDCPLHQIFVTKNYVLCSRLRKQFSKFSDAEDFAKFHAQQKLESMPNDIMTIHDLSYPLFLTARQFYILLDYSLKDNKYFFKRDEEGNMTERIISTDYDHEDTLSDTLFDLDDDADDEPVMLYPTTHKASDIRVRREVTASHFDQHIWPKIKIFSDTMSPLLVWMEIKSFIKGSREAVVSENGELSEEGYKMLGKKLAPNFQGDRERIYELFKSYKDYVQNHPTENLFDECDLVHNLFKRLPKAGDELKWVLHSLYIDEVQDFTQGELWLMLSNCRDPNRLFLTGDTAQSIMSGIAFRFKDVKSLFHHRNVLVPKVQHLTVNFRAHSGILRLASSVTELLKHYFPNSFDHHHKLQEQGLVNGPKPLLLHKCSPTDLAVALAGRKQAGSTIDFGAHQAILVRTKEAKDKLPRALKAAIVLTIFESKGLEFDDLVLYNFFTDSKVRI